MPPLLFGDDGDRQGHINVSVQMKLHLSSPVARIGSRRHAHFAAADRLARFDRRFGDIGGADGANSLPSAPALASASA